MDDEVEQAGGAAVLFKCLLNPVMELSGERGALITSTPAAAQVVREDELLQVGTSSGETPRQLV